MGIGNDIKPKKVYRYVPPHRRVEIEPPQDAASTNGGAADEAKKSVQETEIPVKEHFEKLEELEDDFFHEDYGKEKSESKEGGERPSSFWFQNLNAKNLTWLILIALAVIVVYQNFDTISSLIRQKTGNEVKVSSEKDDFYEGVSKSNVNSNTASENSNANSNLNTNANTNTAAVTPSSAATTATSIDKAAITLRVLNGNGMAGSAETIASQLTTAGFNPVKTGNARKFTYPATVVYYKTGKEAEANLVKEVLSGRETTIENSDSIVGEYDLMVVVGKK